MRWAAGIALASQVLRQWCRCGIHRCCNVCWLVELLVSILCACTLPSCCWCLVHSVCLFQGCLCSAQVAATFIHMQVHIDVLVLVRLATVPFVYNGMIQCVCGRHAAALPGHLQAVVQAGWQGRAQGRGAAKHCACCGPSHFLAGSVTARHLAVWCMYHCVACSSWQAGKFR